jgi:hypothetical protein
MMLRIFLLLAFGLLAACTGKPALDEAPLSDRKLNLEEFFDGQVLAYGQFQDVFGTVRRRFDVEINGTWDGETLTLVEDFISEDNSTEQRVWSLIKTGDNWKYEIDLPVPDGTMRVTFDDWMWLLSDDRLLNRAYMKRAGIDIGDVIITFEKQ